MATASGSMIAPMVDTRTVLREAAAAATEAASRARALAALLDETLAALSAGANSPTHAANPAATAPFPAAPLSRREREVLALVAEGRSNKAIAEALYVSPNTVKTHVASLLHKLQAGSRAQLAAFATSQGLRRTATTAVTI